MESGIISHISHKHFRILDYASVEHHGHLGPTEPMYVGDMVEFEPNKGDGALIKSVLPRRNIFYKKTRSNTEDPVVAVNVDVAFIVTAFGRDFSINRIERFLALVYDADISPVIVLNKSDLISEEERSELKLSVEERLPGLDVIESSFLGETDCAEFLSHIMPGKTCCFLGSSGVGKSTIINTLKGISDIKTTELGDKNERGRHTTTDRYLYMLPNGAYLLDTPGMREVTVSMDDDIEARIFSRIAEYAASCRFKDCSHNDEPGCAVQQALADGELDKEQFANYLKMQKESDYYHKTAYQKKQDDKAFGKMVRQVMSERKKVRGRK